MTAPENPETNETGSALIGTTLLRLASNPAAINLMALFAAACLSREFNFDVELVKLHRAGGHNWVGLEPNAVGTPNSCGFALARPPFSAHNSTRPYVYFRILAEESMWRALWHITLDEAGQAVVWRNGTEYQYGVDAQEAIWTLMRAVVSP